MTTKEPLSRDERAKLRTYEKMIENGITTYRTVGALLDEIRAQRLYRESHATFEDYCRERWQISRPRAYELMNAAAVADELSANGRQNPPPANERVAREIGQVPEDIRANVWQKAVETVPAGKQPTVGTVRQAATQVEEERRAALSPEELIKLEGDRLREHVGELEEHDRLLKRGVQYRALRRLHRDLISDGDTAAAAATCAADLIAALEKIIPEDIRNRSRLSPVG